MEEADDVVIGGMVRVKVVKNKVGPPHREVRLPFYFHPASPVLGFDDAMAQLVYLISRGAVSASGSWYEIEGQRFNGKLAVRDKMVEDPLFAEAVKNRVLEAWHEEHGIR